MEPNRRKIESVKYFREAYQAHLDGNLELAIELYQRSLKAFPTPEAFTCLGLAYSYLNRYEEAIQFCERAIAMDPEFGNPYNDIGSYLIALNKLDDAIPYLEKALKVSRYDVPHFPYFNLGRVYEKKGMLKKARQSYQRALEENSEYAQARDALEELKYVLN